MKWNNKLRLKLGQALFQLMIKLKMKIPRIQLKLKLNCLQLSSNWSLRDEFTTFSGFGVRLVDGVEEWRIKLPQPSTKFKLKFKRWVHYFFRGGWLGGVEEWRIKLSQLSTKLRLSWSWAWQLFQRKGIIYYLFNGQWITDKNERKDRHMFIITFPVCVHAAINYPDRWQMDNWIIC